MVHEKTLTLNLRSKKIYFSAVFLLFSLLLQAQIACFKLETVTFENNATIKSDDGSKVYQKPHWDNQRGDDQYPVCYWVGKKLKASAVLKLAPSTTVPSPLKDKIKVKGKCVEFECELPEKTAKLKDDGVEYPATDADKAFDIITIYDALTIKWSVKIGDQDWTEVGTSENTVYVTYKQPVTIPVFHTIVYLGCVNNDGKDNKVSEESIVSGIYEVFNSKDVGDVDGDPLKYWGPGTHEPDQFHTWGILKNKTGSCGGWANFFVDIIQAQGISGAGSTANAYVAITSRPDQKITGGMRNRIKNSIRTYLPPPDTGYTIKDDYLFFIKGWKLNRADTFAIFQSYSPGQNNPIPPPVFKDHAIVKFNGKYYDPSYGTGPYSSPVDWENNSIDGFGSIVVNSAGLPFFWIDKKDKKGQLETTFTEIDFGTRPQ